MTSKLYREQLPIAIYAIMIIETLESMQIYYNV